MLSKSKTFIYKLLLIIIFTPLLLYNSLLSCTILPKNLLPSSLNIPKNYVSQKHIVYQGFVKLPTPFGYRKAIYFGYDRDNDYVIDINGNKVYIDLLEFKFMKSSGWQFKPFLIFSDDDFDGYADRLLLDSNLDGKFDKFDNLKPKKLSMGEIEFEEISPWGDIGNHSIEI